MTILSFIPKTSIKLFALFKYQLNIAQQQQLEILTLLCYWRINLLTVKVLFIMLQMNHRKHYDVAVDFVHTGCCPDQLNHGSRFTSTAELSSTENNETEYIRSPLLAAWRMLMDFVTLNKQKSAIKSPDKKIGEGLADFLSRLL